MGRENAGPLFEVGHRAKYDVQSRRRRRLLGGVARSLAAARARGRPLLDEAQSLCPVPPALLQLRLGRFRLGRTRGQYTARCMFAAL